MENNNNDSNIQQSNEEGNKIVVDMTVDKGHSLDKKLEILEKKQDEKFFHFAKLFSDKFDELNNSLRKPSETIVKEGGTHKRSTSETIVDDEVDNHRKTRAKRSAKCPLTTTPTKKLKSRVATITNPNPNDSSDDILLADDYIMTLHDEPPIVLDEAISNLTNEILAEPESEDDMSGLWQQINSEIDSKEKTGPQIDPNLATIVNEVWQNPLEKDTFVKKLEGYHRPENCQDLTVKRCNEEIWKHKSLQPYTRQKVLKDQRKQTSIMKGAIAIANIANNLIDLKKDQDMSKKDLKKSLNPLIHQCTDALAFISNANANIDQSRRENLISAFDNSYLELSKNVPKESQYLFGDDLTKRISTISANKKLIQGKFSFSNYNSSSTFSKNLKRFPQNPGSRFSGYKQGQQPKHKTSWTPQRSNKNFQSQKKK